MTKVQLSLTNEEAAILAGFGENFGYNLPKTIRYIISKATEDALKDQTIPVYPMSEAVEQKGLQALKEHEQGRTTKVENIEEYFESL